MVANKRGKWVLDLDFHAPAGFSSPFGIPTKRDFIHVIMCYMADKGFYRNRMASNFALPITRTHTTRNRNVS